MKTKGNSIFHALAVLVAVIWGTTFVSSKLLLAAGLQPSEIMVIRFVIAWICIIPFSIKRNAEGRGGLFAADLRDELLMLILGATGGSLYFLCENSALEYTQASNVSIIITATPLLTTLVFGLLLRRRKLNASVYLFSLLALLGVAVVVFNGEFVLKLHPLGDILTLGAAVMWVTYSVILEGVAEKYPMAMVTRKVFFYGVLTMLPVFLVKPWTASVDVLLQPLVLGNLAFLGIVASFLCFLGWNIAVRRLGSVSSNNYLYLNPVATALVAVPVLHEQFTLMHVAGSMLILFGMYMAGRAAARS